MLQRAITCFLNQTYKPRELVVVYESDDKSTHDYLASLDEPSIRPFMVEVSPKLTLGALRNLSLRFSSGYYFAQWDDDDWHGPTRLAEQIRALQKTGKQGCVLLRWVMYDNVTKTACLSGTRPWEGSIVAVRSTMPLYPDLPKGEDTDVIQQMVSEKRLIGIDKPQLYIYTYHGDNTWERSHWEQRLLPFSQVLPQSEQERVRSLLFE
jgi:glycosyltransferase involved in cell wall biosynthesis